MTAIVQSSAGTLRGVEQDGLSVFKGVSFAQPPLGDLRWRAPQPVQPWQGECDATEIGASATRRRPPGAVGDLIGIPSQTMDEDCLYLNVWAPSVDGSLQGSSLVMVWIHGGGNTVGSGTQPRINGEHLTRRGDVVVVALNDRLGAFGFSTRRARSSARGPSQASLSTARRALPSASPSNRSPSITRSTPTRCSVGPPFVPPVFTPRTPPVMGLSLQLPLARPRWSARGVALAGYPLHLGHHHRGKCGRVLRLRPRWRCAQRAHDGDPQCFRQKRRSQRA